jgi:K+-sensing histidine kinase KdpD
VVRLVVSDDGAGIPSAIMPRLFEPFYTTKGEKGTGLGLWVICNILHKYGGSIDIRSSENPARHGTTFMVRLPIELPPLLTGSGEEQQARHPHQSAEACGIGPGSVPADSSSRPGAA